MVGIRIVILKRVCVCSQPIVTDVLQIVSGEFPVREVQPSLFKAVNLFINSERCLSVYHKSDMSIKIEDPPGALN